MLSWEDILNNAMAFARKWQGAGKEEAQAQAFTLDFIRIFGARDPLAVGGFEVKVPLDDGHNGYIDYLWPGKIAMEMKSPGRNLEKAYAQLKNYVVHLKPEEMPELLLVCDFANFHLHRRISGKKSCFKLGDIKRHIRDFAILAGYEVARRPENQLSVNVRAAEKMASLHDALLNYGYSGHNLEVYLVRLLFCLFADDTGIFPRGAFWEYLQNSRDDGSDLAARLGRLFEILNCPPGERPRHKLLSPTLLQFQYVNGNLFAEVLPQAEFDAKMRGILIKCAEFDWSKISPAIFGSIFQGVMDRNQRRELGAHYTSEENILRLINPLFMDGLWAEFQRIRASPAKLEAFHNRLASISILDPACGCGNFLIIAYRELRRLELAILKLKIATGQAHLDLSYLLKLNVNQFFGIELEEFPAQIAQVGMWLMDHQMNMEAAETFGSYYVRLPLTQKAAIRKANALEIDWRDVVSGSELSYIIGNPPFAGARVMQGDQKEDLKRLFAGQRNAGDLDYVACWFKKADDFMTKFPHVQTAFVATNSITQGIQPALLWKPILANGCHIRFGCKTFKWQNEARGKAAVHCVIIGLDRADSGDRFLFDGKARLKARNINGYLVDAPDIFVESRGRPISDVPQIGIGNKPVDGGNFLFTPERMRDFLALEPAAEPFFRPWLGAEEFLNGTRRYCLWLGGCSPAELTKLPECLKILQKVRDFRLRSASAPTQKLAARPAHFHVENMPQGNFLVIPKTSSETRQYIPLGFEGPETLCGDALFLMPGATLFHFGILSSSVHNAWVRAIAGRLKSDLRYSKDIVFNNFVWPACAEKDQQKIARLARAILELRAGFPDCSLADLYNPLAMPRDLLKAHNALDRAVLRLYGLARADEAAIVARLLELYSEGRAGG